MDSEIRLAGFTLTAEEWDRLHAAIRAELLPVDAAGADDDAFDDEAEVVW